MANRSDGRTGIREVAKKARVAVSSVSRVLSGHPDVSDSMRDRVNAAVRALGYEPDILAQSLRSGSTRTIGILVADISNALFSEIVLGAEATLNEAGYAVLIANSRGISNHDAEQLRVLRQRRVDGFILSVSDERDAATIDQLKNLDRPLVLLDREIEGIHCSAVLSDHDSGIRAAIGHLIELGHSRIALIAGTREVRPSRVRAECLQAVCDAHKGVRGYVHFGSYSAAHGEAAVDALLDRADPPTAILSGGNQILVGVLRTLRRRRLNVPRDISLITCDHIALSEFLDPSLATIGRDPRRMGQMAAQLLLKALRRGPVEIAHLPVNFAPERSCAAPPAAQSQERPRRRVAVS